MKAALIGGAVAGVLSIIPFVSSCCCLWAIGGGLLAVFLYLKKSPTPMQPGDGAMLGATAGVVAAAIYLIIGLPIVMMAGTAQFEQALGQAGVQVPFSGTALLLFGMLMGVVAQIAFAAIGGLIAVPIFGKSGGAGTAPPPPPDFSTPGGTTGGGNFGAGS